MTELTQPLAAAPSEAAVPSAAQSRRAEVHDVLRAGLCPLRLVERAPQGHAHPRRGGGVSRRARRFRGAVRRDRQRLLVLARRERGRSDAQETQVPVGEPISTFHRESDWATQEAPEMADLHHCDELAVKAKTVLTGVRQVICMQLVMACAAHLLSLVDARVTHDEARNAEALAREQKALAFAEEYYDDAANGQAQVSYFVGMAAVAAVIGIGATIWLVSTGRRPLLRSSRARSGQSSASSSASTRARSRRSTTRGASTRCSSAVCGR